MYRFAWIFPTYHIKKHDVLIVLSKPRYNAKSRVDRRFTRVFALSWRRGAAASNQSQKPA